MIEELKLRVAALSVYRTLKKERGFSALSGMIFARGELELAEYWAEYYAALCEAGYENNSVQYFRHIAERDENIFSTRAARGDCWAQFEDVINMELETLSMLGELSPSDFGSGEGRAKFLPKWETGEVWRARASDMAEEYLKYGYGVFADSAAYTWNGETKDFEPVRSLSPIRLTDLKEYEDEKNVIIDNTLSFLDGLPSNNVLLYGDRGTGKSSTVHAILNEYAPDGLRLVEVSKSAIKDFPKIIARLQDFKFRFIIFLDDLTFVEGADDYAELKAALEGSVSSNAQNALIYATTNRRHLLKESHADRGDDIHARDTIEEQMSLSDRFGLVVTFINPDKREFLKILKQIIIDRKIAIEDEKLSVAAEQYALKKGGRSPRAAKQLADMIESKLRRGKDCEI